ncbi:DNA primase [Chloroflexota bacterium]
MSIVDEVKQKTDIVEIVGQYATLTKSGRTFKALCPFHSEKHASFFVYPDQQSWHCFGACNTGGDAFSFIMKKENIDFGDALRILAEKAGVTLPAKSGHEEKSEEKAELYQINEAASQYFHNLLLNNPAAEKVRNYLTSRGFSSQTVTDFQLGFSLDNWESLKQHLQERNYAENKLLDLGLIAETENGKTHDRFRGRLMFPIRDVKGRTIGFGARALDDSQPKYINSQQTRLFDKGSILYGIDLAARAIRQQDMAVIVEGYSDVITAHQNNINNVIASMGTSVTETQINSLKKLTKNLVLAMDADTAGEEAILRSVSYENILDTEMRVVILPKGKDPDDVIKEESKVWRQLVAEAVPIIDYTFAMATSQLNLATSRDKLLAFERLALIVNNIENPVRYVHYRQKLARRLEMNEREIEMALNKMKPHSIRRQDAKTEREMVSQTLRTSVSHPTEEYLLALLLRYPEFKKPDPKEFSEEYFQNSENREIFIAWQQSEDQTSLKLNLDSVLHEYLDALMTKSLLSTNQLEQKYSDCVLRLREEYFKNLEAKRAERFALEVEVGGTGADLASLEKQGIESSVELRKIHSSKKVRGGQSSGGNE